MKDVFYVVGIPILLALALIGGIETSEAFNEVNDELSELKGEIVSHGLAGWHFNDRTGEPELRYYWDRLIPIEQLQQQVEIPSNAVIAGR